MKDKSFYPDQADLRHAFELLIKSTLTCSAVKSDDSLAATVGLNDNIDIDRSVQTNKSVNRSAPAHFLTDELPESGLGERATLETLAPIVFDGAAKLGSETAFAHMDPPTPWVTWITHCWNASLNQNLLHPDVSPIAGELEQRLLKWLTPYFGMSGGHLTPGSTISNLTALWVARDVKSVHRVIASSSAHISIDKAARILGLEIIKVPTNKFGQLEKSKLPTDLSHSALVLTAGTTSEGAIDPLDLAGDAAWTHIDAAWAGPLRFSDKYAAVLAGIENADSIAVSAHKWLYQPKECGVLMFKDVSAANETLSVNGAYLSQPNIGLLGSHGATAIPLLATLIAWGRAGLATRIDAGMGHADALNQFLQQLRSVQVFSENVSGVVLWKTSQLSCAEIVRTLPSGAASMTTVDGCAWVRHVSANPNVEIDRLMREISRVLNG